MPIYEYECQACGERLETIQRFADPPLTECPECKGRLRRLISAPAFQFKGSGWYVTDYARGGGKDGGAAEKSGKETSTDKKESAGDSGSAASAGGDKSGGAETTKKTATTGESG